MRTIVLLILLAVSLMTLGCSSDLEQKGVSLGLKMSPERLSDFLFVKMDYTINITPEFENIKDDYVIFVHFWRKKTKEMIAQDDHPAMKATSTWKKGDVVSYSRTIFIPRFFDEYAFDYKKEELIRLSIGLYKPNSKENKIILYQKDLTLESSSDVAPAVFYDIGWHQPEVNLKADQSDETKWRWTTQKAVCIIENPRKVYDLRIRGGISKKDLSDQKVIIKINDTILDQFIPETAKFDKIYKIVPEMMGDQDEFQLTFEADKAFVPAVVTPGSIDERELGMQIYFLYFRESIQ